MQQHMNYAHMATTAPMPAAASGHACPTQQTDVRAADAGQGLASTTAASSAVPATAAASAAAAPPIHKEGPNYQGAFLPLWEGWRVQWQVQTDWDNNWTDYDSNFCLKLESTYHSSGDKAFQHQPHGKVWFNYDVQNLVQKNMETQKIRLMRRVLVHPTERDPEHQRKSSCVDINTKQHNLDACRVRMRQEWSSSKQWQSRSRSKSARR